MRAWSLSIPVFLLLASLAGAADERHPLSRALDYDTNLLLINDLQLSNRQLMDVVVAARSVGRLVAGQDKARADMAAKQAELLDRERTSLTQGAPLAEIDAAALRNLEEMQLEQTTRMYAAVNAELRRARRAFNPSQAALVDWTRPADVPAASDPAALVEELRLLAARLSEAGRFIERIRYLIVSDYSTTRIGRVEEFLRPYLRPGTRDFEESRDWILGLLNDARQVKEADWPLEAPVFAAQLLQHLGLLDEAEATAAGQQTRYNWWDMFYLLSDPQTPQMLQNVMAARGTPQQD